MNRIATAIANVRPRVEALDEEAAKGLDKTLAVDFSEHFAFQQEQARQHAMGKLTPDEAMIIYTALGEVGSDENGGWAKGTDLATKVIVTQAITELMKQRMGIR